MSVSSSLGSKAKSNAERSDKNKFKQPLVSNDEHALPSSPSPFKTPDRSPTRRSPSWSHLRGPQYSATTTPRHVGLRLVGSAYALPQDTTTKSASTDPIAHTAAPVRAPLANAIAPVPVRAPLATAIAPVPVRAPPDVAIVPTITPPPVHPATTDMSLSAIGTSAHAPLAATSTAPTVTSTPLKRERSLDSSSNFSRPAPPPVESLPSPPDDWSDKRYYLDARCSYEKGGKEGQREGKGRGGRVKVEDSETGKQVTYKTFLERMPREKKYAFVKEYGHPFAAVAGLEYFNPYGKVPLHDGLTLRIDKTHQSMFIAIGQRLDYSEYLDTLAVVRAAVTDNLPRNAQIDSGKLLKWSHFGPSSRKAVYNYVYQLKPYLYHFRDRTGEDNWAIAGMASAYLDDSNRNNKRCKCKYCAIDGC
ncbi:hypothetical protein BN14_11344 [Rhizoctonia solani AG-1 IB]|uniref:Uncharacterized protein n=1 Tax=Thanatephorus cucumeris (strain AG1-IB / isolate 7/3/14) TaxID=1108050 RepID=M5CDI8_THACB|nr:hypothetical protein BN14_11344 [Rhizoctonia solani AG-1 IB]